MSSEAPVIKSPRPNGKAVKSLADFLEISGEWHNTHSKSDGGMLSDLWYRGVNRHFDYQAPGVYRSEFTQRAELVHSHDSVQTESLDGTSKLPRKTRSAISFHDFSVEPVREFNRMNAWLAAVGLPSPMGFLSTIQKGNQTSKKLRYAMPSEKSNKERRCRITKA